MTTVVAFALVITVLVFVHELGHFLAARWFGVPVEVFSIGFGPRLWSVRRGGVEYRISAIPFGGYVKMAGTGSRGPERARSASRGGFDAKPRWQRFLILLAGPVMNIAFALVLAIAGLFLLLVLAFGRPRDALIVMVNLPLALIGGVVGVFLSGGVLNVATMIGFILRSSPVL